MHYDKNTISSFPTILTRLILIIIFAACVHIPGLKILTAARVWSQMEHVQDDEMVRNIPSLFCIREPRSHKLRCAHKIPWAASENERQDELWRHVKYRAIRTAVVKRRYHAVDMRMHLSILGAHLRLSVHLSLCVQQRWNDSNIVDRSALWLWPRRIKIRRPDIPR